MPVQSVISQKLFYSLDVFMSSKMEDDDLDIISVELFMP
jgi:hypothetical protein